MSYGKYIRNVRAGDPISAGLWNDVAGAINNLTGARTLEPQAFDGEVAGTLRALALIEVGRTTSTERVTNVDDDSIYVDVTRPQRLYFLGSDGTLVSMLLAS